MNRDLEAIFYWLNNTKGYITDYEYKVLCKDYLGINNIDYNVIEKLNYYIECGSYSLFEEEINNILESEVIDNDRL